MDFLFEEPCYFVNEGDGNVDFAIITIGGVLDRNLTLDFRTVAGTASSEGKKVPSISCT